jgi:hypothetical protein
MPKTTTQTAEETPRPRAKRTRRISRPSSRRRSVAPSRVTHEQIALRAYELHMLGAGADPTENWLRAERELVKA